MAFGARPFGGRTFGDSTGDAGAVEVAPPDEIFAAISLTGTGSISFATTEEASIALDASADMDATATIVVEWSRIEFTGTGNLDVTPQMSGTQRRVIIVDHDGNPISEIENAQISPIIYELNQAEQWTFTFPTDDAKLSSITDEYVREAQLWRGDQLLSWGPIVRPQIRGATTEAAVQGAMWHLGRRNIGKAQRTNYVTNGDFEDGLAHWTLGTLSVLEPVANKNPAYWSGTIRTNRQITGRRSLYLEQVDPTRPKYGFEATQLFFWDVPVANLEGDKWTLVAYAWIDSAKWRSSLPGRHGMTLQRSSLLETVDIIPEGGGDPITFPVSIETSTVPIDDNTEQDTWIRMEVPLRQPITGDAEIIRVRLASPNGAVYWDRVSLTLDEATRFYDVDQATIACELVDHLQDPAYDKSDVNITGDCQTTGITRDRVYYHSEHPNGLRSIEEFTTLSDGFDIGMVYTPVDRFFKTYFPQKGRHLPKFALETGRNISSFAWVFDAESAATSVIVLGVGSGSGREEAAAIDVGNFAGLTLEEVFVAPPDAKIEALDNIAEERLEVTRAPEVLSVRTTSPLPNQKDPVGVLEVGDTVPVRIEQGALLITGTYRITRLSINPDDTLDLVLNKRTLET